VTDPHLITVDELRAAGALDVPPTWRKSLGGETEFLPLFADDDPPHAQPDTTRIDPPHTEDGCAEPHRLRQHREQHVRDS
jgi:hypothetical protein